MRQNIRLIPGFLVVLLVITLGYANAATRTKACVKYLNTNKAYNVEVTLISGQELNQKTRTLNYDCFSTYAVIFWSNSNATLIKLNYFIGSLNMFGNRGVDQRGYPWSVSSNTSFCY